MQDPRTLVGGGAAVYDCGVRKHDAGRGGGGEDGVVEQHEDILHNGTGQRRRVYCRRRERRTSSDSMVQHFMDAKTWMCGMAGKQNVYWFCHSAAHCSRRSANENGGDGAERCEQAPSTHTNTCIHTHKGGDARMARMSSRSVSGGC